MTYLFRMYLLLYYLAFCDSMKNSFAYQEKNFVKKYLMLVSLRIKSLSSFGGSGGLCFQAYLFQKYHILSGLDSVLTGAG
jgi:hypothetical protein